jgi:hypothetical protein
MYRDRNNVGINVLDFPNPIGLKNIEKKSEALW